MKRIVFIVLLFAVAGCGRKFDAGSDSYYLKVLSNSRQLAQAALIYESQNGKSDADGLVCLDELISGFPEFQNSGFKSSVENRKIIFVSQRMPISRSSVITITAVGDYVGITKGDMATETFIKK